MPPKPVTARAFPTPPLVPAAAPGPPREDIEAIAAAVLAKLTKQLDEAADTRFKAYAEKVIRFTDQFALRVEANLQDAANRTEDQMVVSTQQKLDALADRVQASRTNIENLLARLEALQKKSRTVVEDTDQKIRKASHLAFESAQQKLAVNLRKEVERTSATLEGECQALVLDAVTRTVNATLAKADKQLAVQTKDRLSKAYAELKWHQEQMIEGIKEQLNQIALSGTSNLQELRKTAEAFSKSVDQRSELAIGSVQSAAEQGASKLRAAQLESVRSLRADVEDYQSQLAARSGLALESFQSGLQTLTREMQEGAAQLFSQKLQCIADELAEASAEKVRQQIQDEAVAATERISKESNKRLSAMADEFSASLSKELQERLRTHAEAQLDSLIQSAPDKFNEGLNKLTRDAGLTLVKVTGNELRKLARTLFASSSETLRKEVGQLADNLYNDMKAFQATLGDQARNQLLAMSQSTVETLKQEAWAGVEEFRARLHAAAQESHEESLRKLETHFREVLEKQRAAIFVLLQQRTR
ncbi:MAG TPA: hypothetical protein VKO18_15320 [Terriglobia bacterium]|nr:hypothetical protein [Terriglobia bacterium]